MTAHSRRAATFLSAVTLAGAAARFLPLFHDFWLDEIWSYRLVRDLVHNPTDILFKLPIDNNHPLNSLALHLLGTGRAWPIYRLPAWFCGVFCIPLSYLVMLRFGERHAFYAVWLAAFSYPLIVYSTEARGYGLMLCLLLLAVYFTQRFLADRDWSACGMVWTAVILGTLSHLTFIHGYLALLVFSGYELHRRNARLADALMDGLKLHSVPLLFFVVFYWVFVRHVIVGGSAPTGLIHTMIEATTMALGGPNQGPLVIFCSVGFVAILLAGLHRMKMRSGGWHLLFACGIVLVPLPLVTLSLVFRPGAATVFPRYFLTSILLFLLLTGFLLGELHNRGGRQRVLAGVLFAMILGGNIVHSARFTWVGRGGYFRALRYIVRESPVEPIHVASNSDFRTSQILSFYLQFLPADRRIVYHSRQEVNRSETIVEWWIVEFRAPQQRAPPELTTDRGRFSLQRYFDFYGPSGCGWAVYRRSVPRA